jgi:hypothetical protein
MARSLGARPSHLLPQLTHQNAGSLLKRGRRVWPNAILLAQAWVRRFWAEADIRKIEERFNRMNSDLSRLAARDYKLGQGKPK